MSFQKLFAGIQVRIQPFYHWKEAGLKPNRDHIPVIPNRLHKKTAQKDLEQIYFPDSGSWNLLFCGGFAYHLILIRKALKNIGHVRPNPSPKITGLMITSLASRSGAIIPCRFVIPRAAKFRLTNARALINRK